MTDTLASLIDPEIATAIASAIGAAAVGLWLAATWWAYGDMGRRSSSDLARFAAIGWIVLSTPVLLPFSLPVYLLTRPQATIAQRRSREMVDALGPAFLSAATCDACGLEIDDAWRRCPSCATWLQVACLDCEAWSPRDLDICPWCATDRSALPLAPAAAPEAIALASRGSRRSGVAAGGAPAAFGR